jgi:hypothetical protein
MTNTGVAPYDPATLVGKVRVMTGDVNYGTPAAGVAQYELFSDAEINSFLLAGEDNVLRASGFAYLALAGRAAVDAKSVKDYDLSIDLRSRADKLQAQAKSYFDQADEKDKRDGVQDVFELARTGRELTIDELAEPYNWLWVL